MHNPTASRARSILWVTLTALLLVALTSRMEVRTCLGDCQPTVATDSCCAAPSGDVESTVDDGCCGCCDEGSPERAPGDDEPGDDGDGAGGREGGCCVTIAFDVDMAPNVDAAKAPLAIPAICWVTPLPVPAWLVNVVQRSWARTTRKSLCSNTDTA